MCITIPGVLGAASCPSKETVYCLKEGGVRDLPAQHGPYLVLFGLVEMFLLAKGTNPQEEIFLGSKLTEIFFLTKVKLAQSKYAY